MAAGGEGEQVPKKRGFPLKAYLLNPQLSAFLLFGYNYS